MGVGFYFRIWCGFSWFILVFSSSKVSGLNETEEIDIGMTLFTGSNNKMKNLGIFYREAEIFDILLDERNRNRRNVTDLVKAYKENCCVLGRKTATKDKPRRPFIVIESNYRPPRKQVAKQLADILNGVYISVPPKCLREFLYMFDYSPDLRRAYFGLALYAAAHEVREIYTDKPVITSGYWSDQTSFAIAREFDMDNIPEVGHSVYNWPEDLLKPDVSFLLTVPHKNMEENPGTTQYPDDFQKKRLVAFRRMRRPRLREISGIYYYDTILAQMQSKMLTVFQHPRWKRKHVRY